MTSNNSDPHVFQIGDRVVLIGLRAANHLNDRHGTVGTLPDAVSGRIGVDLDLDPAQARVNAKPGNLVAEEQPLQHSERAPAGNGTLIELHHGRAASFLLEVMRYLAAVQFLSEPDVQEFHDIHKIRTTQGQRGLMRLNHFNATAWSNWLDDDGEVQHRQKGVFNLLRTYFHETLTRANQPFKETNPMGDTEISKASEALDCIEAAASWHIRIHGDFWVVGHDEEGGTGTYLVPNGNQHMVYKILGVHDALFPMLRPQFGETPVLMTMTLIPWYGRIVYDGVTSHTGFTRPMMASEKRMQRLRDAVRSAVEEGRVVERIAELEIPGATTRVAILSGPSRSASTNPTHTELPQDIPSSPSPPTEEESEYVQQIIAVRAFPAADRKGNWVYRRMGYSEVENPTHMGLVMLGNGMCMGPFQCSALRPTVRDILKDLVEKCNTGMPPIPAGQRPWAICIDDKTCCQRLQYLFRDHCNFRVEYYRPPSKEEENSAHMMGPGSCI